MWYFNGQIIKTPKSMNIGDFQYTKDLFKDAKDVTITLMERGVKDLGDMQLAKLIDIGSKYKWEDIDGAIEEVAQGTEFKDLTLKQLDLIQGYLDYEKMRLERF